MEQDRQQLHHPHHHHYPHIPKLGMRIIKTALAVLATMLVCDLLLGRLILGRTWYEALSISTFAVIGAVITIQNSVRSTFKAALERSFGTLIGVLVGLLFLGFAILSFDRIYQGAAVYIFYLLITAGTLIVIYLCKIIKFASASSLCVIVFVSVMFAVGSQTPLPDAAWRVTGTILGVVIAVAINLLIFPPTPERCGLVGCKLGGDTYAYKHEGNLYLNITNRCCNDCEFCVRRGGNFCEHELWLSREPETREIIERLKAFKKSEYKEVVFCGYGESTYRMSVIKGVGKYVRTILRKPVRLNTNGLGNLINGRDIVPELVGAVDTVSVSLNQCDAAKYQKIARSMYGECAFDEVVEWTKSAKAAGLRVGMSVVGIIPQEDIEKCREIAESIGVELRVRGKM